MLFLNQFAYFRHLSFVPMPFLLAVASFSIFGDNQVILKSVSNWSQYDQRDVSSRIHNSSSICFNVKSECHTAMLVRTSSISSVIVVFFPSSFQADLTISCYTTFHNRVDRAVVLWKPNWSRWATKTVSTLFIKMYRSIPEFPFNVIIFLTWWQFTILLWSSVLLLCRNR